MYSSGRYLNSSMNNNPNNYGPTLTISDSDNRDPIASAMLKASSNQSYRGKSPMANPMPLPTHSYYTRSKSVFDRIWFVLQRNFSSLVLFQILKCTKKESSLSLARARACYKTLFRFYTHFSCAKSCVCVFLFSFFFFNENCSSIRFVFLFVVARFFALTPMEASFFFEKEQVFSLSLVCMHFFLLSLFTDAAATIEAFFSTIIYMNGDSFFFSSRLVYVFWCNLKTKNNINIYSEEKRESPVKRRNHYR